MTHPVLDEFAATYDFPLDDYQLQGCRELEDGRGVLVAAPTGAGKTVVGEFAVHLARRAGRKCFYTTPIKALSNQKYADLVAVHGEAEVGLLTGDTTINGEAPVVVMTTEVLRNMLYAGSRTLLDLGYVVMDEVHYLADRSRGAVWEEVIIHLPESVALVSLSATVSNAEEFGEWLAEVRGDTATIVAEKRPVPLFQHVMVGRKLLDLFASSDVDAAAGFVREDAPVNDELLRIARDDWAASRMRDRRAPKGKRGRGGPGNRRNVGNGRRVWIPGRIDVIDQLERHRLLPALVFIFSRAGCDGAVQQCLDANLRLTTPEERDEAIDHVEGTLGRLPGADLEVLGYTDFLDAVSRGVAAHHAGMLPAFKKCVEELYLRGLVKVVFATETLALGINMPARTVVLEKLSKWNGENHADITPGEYTQLTGRAGRRGLDTEGHAVVLWQPGMNPKEVAGMASTRTYPLRSSFRPSYNMAVNLVHSYGRHRSRELLEQSFAQFQADRAVVGLARRLRRAEDALAGYAEAAECHLGDFMEYAGLRREINDLEKAGKRARSGGKHQDRKRKEAEKAQTVRIAKLRRTMKAHPCHECEDREDHARWAERWFRLDKDTRTLARRIERRTNTVARQFDRVCEVLTVLGYLDGDTVTELGRPLARIYSELDLVAAEALRTGLWDDLTPSELVSVLSVLVFEARRPDDAEPRLPRGAVADRIAEMARLSEELHRVEKDHRLDFLRPLDAGFAWTAYRWAEGDPVDELLQRGRFTAGDFVRQMKQLVDFTGQVADAAGDSPVRRTAREGVDLIRRGIVAAE
ncbi:DEAD/DEAH box helicase [Nocardioides panacisoli]|uniref:DEAD/DEAH box helicase n=1 Tax=Nocardioides panacisoli TaxID=627624 RepID=UPI001C62BED6|nr:DEAD/DEAH box helicase [Nocardioides panacisoli]QYJ05064.1 DEAD/DEAH box helicase [Nocardioides panacisoli]